MFVVKRLLSGLLLNYRMYCFCFFVFISCLEGSLKGEINEMQYYQSVLNNQHVIHPKSVIWMELSKEIVKLKSEILMVLSQKGFKIKTNDDYTFILKEAIMQVRYIFRNIFICYQNIKLGRNRTAIFLG